MALVEMTPRFNPESDYRLMTEQVLPELGFNPEAAGVPALEQVAERLLPIGNWLVGRAAAGITDRLVIAPRVGGENGMGASRLIAAQDSRAFSDGYVWTAMWGDEQGNGGAHSDRSSDHDNGLEAMWDVAVLLGDTTDLSSSRPAYDPGLMHTNLTVKEQRNAHNTEVAAHKQYSRTLVSATVGQMVVDSKALKAEGEPQRAGVTRLTHYPERTVHGDSYVPCVYSDDGRLHFDGSDVGDDWDGRGLRRAVRV